jgi:hypothetical protein
MKQNITLSIEKDLIQKAKVLAAQRHSSISQMLSQELERLVSDTEQFEIARKIALGHLQSGFHLGGKGITSREALHAR